MSLTENNLKKYIEDHKKSLLPRNIYYIEQMDKTGKYDLQFLIIKDKTFYDLDGNEVLNASSDECKKLMDKTIPGPKLQRLYKSETENEKMVSFINLKWIDGFNNLYTKALTSLMQGCSLEYSKDEKVVFNVKREEVIRIATLKEVADIYNNHGKELAIRDQELKASKNNKKR